MAAQFCSAPSEKVRERTISGICVRRLDCRNARIRTGGSGEGRCLQFKGLRPSGHCQLELAFDETNLILNVKRITALPEIDRVGPCIRAVEGVILLRFELVTQRDEVIAPGALIEVSQDRKSTRLNSSHVAISYAV